jgi:hypothetical protein
MARAKIVKAAQPNHDIPLYLSRLTSPSNIPVPGTSPAEIRERLRRRRIKKLTEEIAAKKAQDNGYGGTDQGAGGSSYT